MYNNYSNKSIIIYFFKHYRVVRSKYDVESTLVYNYFDEFYTEALDGKKNAI